MEQLYNAHFHWLDGKGVRTELAMTRVTKGEAFARAEEWGYRKCVWYRPSTWGNHCTFSAILNY